jgi:hypothetical protein
MKKALSFVFTLPVIMALVFGLALAGCDNLNGDNNNNNNGKDDGPETVATPTADPVGGTYYFGQTVSVTISCATPYAEIYYTTDGTDPDTSDLNLIYYTPILIRSPATTIKATAIKTDMDNSAMLTAVYTAIMPPDFEVDLDFAQYYNPDGTLNFADETAALRALNTIRNSMYTRIGVFADRYPYSDEAPNELRSLSGSKSNIQSYAHGTMSHSDFLDEMSLFVSGSRPLFDGANGNYLALEQIYELSMPVIVENPVDLVAQYSAIYNTYWVGLDSNMQVTLGGPAFTAEDIQAQLDKMRDDFFIPELSTRLSLTSADDIKCFIAMFNMFYDNVPELKGLVDDIKTKFPSNYATEILNQGYDGSYID